jgi:hypothetical protein
MFTAGILARVDARTPSLTKNSLNVQTGHRVAPSADGCSSPRRAISPPRSVNFTEL